MVSEREAAQTEVVSAISGLKDYDNGNRQKLNELGNSAVESESLVSVINIVSIVS